MSTVSEAASHIFLSVARFHELLSQGAITSAARGAYDLNVVREEYIRHIRAQASGHGRDGAGLAAARAELLRERTAAAALKNAITRGEYVSVAIVRREVETMLVAFRERVLSMPGKIATSCEMLSRIEVEEIVRHECYEALEELSRPVAAGGNGRSDTVASVT